MSKTISPIRRSELIAPFGIGAMLVARNGLGLVTAGLDHWFEREDGTTDNIDLQEYRVDEWRLKDLLKVDHFRLPPDFRRKGFGKDVPNTELTVPFLRFPCWSVCPTCKLLVETSLTSRDLEACPDCNQGKGGRKQRRVFVRQVPFVAICDQGHLQDFPWKEWVHKNAFTKCTGKMRLSATGGATLESQYVKCECGASRNLSGITAANPDGTTNLSKNLEPDGPDFLCQGKRPWLGLDDGEACTRHLRGSLRSASNVYFGQIRSALYLPRGNDIAPSELVSLMEQLPLSGLIDMLNQLGQPVTPQRLRQQHQPLLKGYSDAQLNAAINIIKSNGADELEENLVDEDFETSFRRSEFNILRSGLDENILRAKPVRLNLYDNPIPDYFSKVTLVEKLRETRVLEGFTRIYSENGQSIDDYKRLLWRDPPDPLTGWLPANIIYGEGIYLELNEKLLHTWLKAQDQGLTKRTARLVANYKNLQQSRHLRDRPIGSRLILLHTLSHLIMNRLTFECGYSSASLRERLYISNHESKPMAGVLIYTAAGDSEGTLGGLVRMGKPGNLEPVIQRAIENARWCAADPICMEIGAAGGQGPDSCNLAACHNCALVPETACEEFNRFLDRALIIGEKDNPNFGFFSDL